MCGLIDSGQTSGHFGLLTWLLVSFFLFLSLFGLQVMLNMQNDPEQIADKFQKDIFGAGEKVRKNLDQFISGFDTTAAGIREPATETVETYHQNDELLFFVYKKDSLVYWNNNCVILPGSFPQEFTGNDLACHLRNGWYVFSGIRHGTFLFAGGYLVKNEYPFQNDYISDGFSEFFTSPASVIPATGAGKYMIRAADGSYLFRLIFTPGRLNDGAAAHIGFLIFLAGLLAFLRFLYLFYSRIPSLIAHGNVFTGVYTVTVVLLRWIISFVGFPSVMSHSALFGPALYSSSSLLPSLGGFTADALILVAISLVFYKKASVGATMRDDLTARVVFAGSVAMLLPVALFGAVCYFMSDLAMNSAVSLNLQNISGLVPESGYSLLIIALLQFSFWLVGVRVLLLVTAMTRSGRWFPVLLVPGTLLWIVTSLLFPGKPDLMVGVFFLAFVLLFHLVKRREGGFNSIQNTLLYIGFFALLSTFVLNKAYREKEREELSLMAGKLATRRNPVTETLYEQAERKILTDSAVKTWFKSGSQPFENSEERLADYIKKLAFSDYWKKYQVQVTLCDQGKELRIQPQGYRVNCNAYFRQIVREYGEPTILPTLWFLDYGSGREFYLAVIRETGGTSDTVGKPAIFIEISLNNTYPDPGYPGLLMDKSRFAEPQLPDYSYALYQDGHLVRAIGVNDYRLEFSRYGLIPAGTDVYSEGNTVHFIYRVSARDILIISKKGEGLLSVAAPFAYLFILFSLMALMVSAAVVLPSVTRPFSLSLRNRLQLSLTAILLAAMVAAGIIQVSNILSINSKKDADNLREKAYSVLVEVQHKYGGLPGHEDISASELENFLVKLSNVFFTDIHVYSESGRLTATSRLQIFEEGLLSNRMNPLAFRKLVKEKNAIFIQQESIGTMKFNSAYLPFYNDHDKLLGFINLPYFTRQDEAKKEISSFLVTFINVYILLIILGIFVIVLISNYITAPLAILSERISRLRIGRANEKIPWRYNDEIGRLVNEYNRMIDELQRSAELLATSERESAWRAMARQVAHEIKNPLTPMKLSAQHIERTWRDNAPDREERTARFIRTLIEQIDALSVIASDFSDFAKISDGAYFPVDPEEVIRVVLSMYEHSPGIRYDFTATVSGVRILADRSQLVRLFTNLVNNAVQAIGDKPGGVISIALIRDQERIVVTVGDNGCGIPEDKTGRIFQPDFTTKASGMGLGLAIVKGIIDTMKGEISFSSEEGTGTVFTLKFHPYDQT